MRKRKRAKVYRAWAEQTRATACHNARDLTLAMLTARPATVPVYDLGIVLDDGEVVYQTCPAGFFWLGQVSHTEHALPGPYGGRARSWQITRDRWFSEGMLTWAITSHRLAARRPNGQLSCLYWGALTGVTIDLPAERVTLDGDNGGQWALTGPAVAPIAVAAVAMLHGPHALLDHPALAPLRVQPAPPPRRGPVGEIANPPEIPIHDMISKL